MNQKQSTTYKLRTGVSDHALYFIIVGDKKPSAFFINSKELESFQWITALMTAYHREINAGVKIESIIKDMKESFDPNGKYIIPDGSGVQVNSVIHHLGLVLEKHISITDHS